MATILNIRARACVFFAYAVDLRAAMNLPDIENKLI
jgi:hypothetical protein